MKKVTIGLTGKFAAGKGTLADLLMARGFRYHSLSDVLRKELEKRGQEESRVNLTQIGNELRKEHGPAALALMIQPYLEEGDRHIVDSIRNPREVDALRQVPGFFLLGVDAPRETRFERLRKRNRQGDPESFEAFCELEDREIHSSDPSSQQLAETWKQVDAVLDNGGSKEELEQALLLLLEERGLSSNSQES